MPGACVACMILWAKRFASLDSGVEPYIRKPRNPGLRECSKAGCGGPFTWKSSQCAAVQLILCQEVAVDRVCEPAPGKACPEQTQWNCRTMGCENNNWPTCRLVHLRRHPQWIGPPFNTQQRTLSMASTVTCQGEHMGLSSHSNKTIHRIRGGRPLKPTLKIPRSS